MVTMGELGLIGEDTRGFSSGGNGVGPPLGRADLYKTRLASKSDQLLRRFWSSTVTLWGRLFTFPNPSPWNTVTEFCAALNRAPAAACISRPSRAPIDLCH